jgi:Domain of unknown function (DUF4965)
VSCIEGPVGSNYPNVTGIKSVHNQEIERWFTISLLLWVSFNHIWCTESGNMLIMTYAHARATGDGSLISRYVSRCPWSSPYKADRLGQYRVLTSWADYLVNTLLFIHDQYVCLH